MKEIKDLLQSHSFFQNFQKEHLNLIAGCGKNQHVKKGDILFHEGSSCDTFFVLREGMISLELCAPGSGSVTIETVEAGAIIGWSWIFPPYQWTYTGRCLRDCRLTALDGKCLRQKCETEHELGYVFMSRFAQIIIKRLQTAHLQLLDLYGDKQQ